MYQIIEKIIQGYKNKDPSLSQYIEQLNQSTPHFSSTILSYCVQNHQNLLVSILRPLLQCDATSLDTIQAVIKLFQENALSGKEAFACISELHVRLYNYRNYNNCSDLKEILQQVCALITSETTEVNGIIHVLDVLPTIITAAQYVETRYDIPKCSKQMIHSVLDAKWPSRLLLSLMKVFVDLQIEEPEFREKLVKRIEEASRNIERANYAPLVQLLLQLAEKYKTAEYINIIGSLFARVR